MFSHTLDPKQTFTLPIPGPSRRQEVPLVRVGMIGGLDVLNGIRPYGHGPLRFKLAGKDRHRPFSDLGLYQSLSCRHAVCELDWMDKGERDDR